MKINSREKSYLGNAQVYSFISFLSNNEKDLELGDSNLYFDFPIFKDLDNEIVISQVLIISRNHGVLIVIFDNCDADCINNNEHPIMLKLENLYSILFSRLLRNKSLRRSKNELAFQINSLVYNDQSTDNIIGETSLISNFDNLSNYLAQIKVPRVDPSVYYELISTIEGAKAIIRAKERPHVTAEDIKGAAAVQIELEINSFDEYQKHAFMSKIIGPERVRGLAGSGKTVVLAIKAAITHLRDPDATIVYTFYTKSLYQHIKRLITRFYRQYDDKDPDWGKLKILHAWGGYTNPGIYFEVCERSSLKFYNFTEAQTIHPLNPFQFACDSLFTNLPSIPIYDYIFIDEGQDFPESFIQICLRVCREGRIVWAYDELQTIFQVETPSIDSVLDGSGYKGLEEDIILYKCYRNPREILVTAHSIGLGIYGNRIQQMLDKPEYWNDIGYKVISGEFHEGDKITIHRPIENSLEIVSNLFKKEDIVKFMVCESFDDEISFCVNNILKDIHDGLLPDDILVITVDDRNSQSYFKNIQRILAESGIKVNNMHSDKFSIKDFFIKDQVTLSTIHKAKGNEAYSVHVIGIDSLYSLEPSIRERNLMFTAITRAKGWVTISGIGNSAAMWVKELNLALDICPNIEFIYPSQEEITVMKMDLSDNSTRKSKQAKMIDELLSEMTPEEIRLFLEQREIKKR